MKQKGRKKFRPFLCCCEIMHNQTGNVLLIFHIPVLFAIDCNPEFSDFYLWLKSLFSFLLFIVGWNGTCYGIPLCYVMF